MVERQANKAAYQRGYRARLRAEVLALLGGDVPRCVRCGCDDRRLLEINHVHGGGRQEHLQRASGSDGFYRDILAHGRTDLELLCRPCNHVAYLETLYGPLPFRVEWGSHAGKH